MKEMIARLPQALRDVFARVRAHLFSGWPIAIVWVACFSAAIYFASAGVPPVLPLALSLIGGVILIIWEGGVLRAMTGQGAGFRLGTGEVKYAVSIVLFGIILILGAIIILLPVIMLTMALWALVSFDMNDTEMSEEALAASFEAFQSQPLFWLCVLILMVGLAGFGVLIMRGAGYAAASVAERRVVAMEAFHWTRGQGTFLFLVGLTTVLPFLALTGVGNALMAWLSSGGSAGQLLGSFCAAVSMWPGMVAALALSAYVYHRYRNAPAAERRTD